MIKYHDFIRLKKEMNFSKDILLTEAVALMLQKLESEVK